MVEAYLNEYFPPGTQIRLHAYRYTHKNSIQLNTGIINISVSGPLKYNQNVDILEEQIFIVNINTISVVGTSYTVHFDPISFGVSTFDRCSIYWSLDVV